jgi:hypothetical protein
MRSTPVHDRIKAWSETRYTSESTSNSVASKRWQERTVIGIRRRTAWKPMACLPPGHPRRSRPPKTSPGPVLNNSTPVEAFGSLERPSRIRRQSLLRHSQSPLAPDYLDTQIYSRRPKQVEPVKAIGVASCSSNKSEVRTTGNCII